MKQNNILHTILETKHKEVADLRTRLSMADAKAQAADAPRARDFYQALTKTPRRAINLIAEVKKASPSAGIIRPDFDPPIIARQYATGGADAISVLTDEHYFQGSLDFLRQVRKAVDLPIIRKDFIIDPLQIYQARACGADAVLLIAAALEAAELGELLGLAASLGMTCLVEVHNSAELASVHDVLKANPRNLLGINNRDLITFTVDLGTTAALIAELDLDMPVVSESGIKTPADVARVAAAGACAILVGETLMRQPDPAIAITDLLGPQS